MLISYNWLQNYFEEKLPSPEKVSEGIIFHSFEVESFDRLEVGGKEDWIFDIKILPDRAHDCLSHWGIAKEISMIFGLKINKDGSCSLKGRFLKEPSQEPSFKATNLKIEIKDDRCLRYMGRIVRNVKVGESPDWLKEKLQAIGQKSINNIVDVANFVMFDLGQPIHSFDLDKLESEKILIRNGKTGENITTLDKKKLTSKITELLEKNIPGKYYYNGKPLFEKLKKDVKTEGKVYQWRRQYVRENKSGVCPTLTANMGMGGHNVPIVKDKKGIRKLTPLECAKIQGFPSNFKLPNIADSALYKQLGNSVSVPVVETVAKEMMKAME